MLVDGDDMNEPIADAVRSILDGHVVLTRRSPHSGHYPAIDVLQSVSRLIGEIVTPEVREAGERLRAALAAYREKEDLISIGAYQPGTDPMLDAAIGLRPAIDAFLKQRVDEPSAVDEADAQLLGLAARAGAADTRRRRGARRPAGWRRGLCPAGRCRSVASPRPRRRSRAFSSAPESRTATLSAGRAFRRPPRGSSSVKYSSSSSQATDSDNRPAALRPAKRRSSTRAMNGSSFRFRLERVRALRERREDAAKQELAGAMMRHRRCEDEVNAAAARLAGARAAQVDATRVDSATPPTCLRARPTWSAPSAPTRPPVRTSSGTSSSSPSGARP